MTAKEYLKAVKQIRSRVQVLQLEIEKLRTDAESIGINLDGMPRGSSGRGARWEELAIQLAEHETQLVNEMSRLYTAELQAREYIAHLKHDKHREVLTRRYLQNQKWEVIAYEMDISWQSCFNFRRDAIRELEKIFDEFPNLDCI